MTAKRFSLVAASILTLTAACMAPLASSASAKAKHGAASQAPGAQQAPRLQNDNSAVDQLFRKPNHVEAWKNAFPS